MNTSFENAIENLETTLQKILEQQEAAKDPYKLVALEKQERQTRDKLTLLRRTQVAAKYRPPEPSDTDELLQGLQKYQERHFERIDGIKGKIRAADVEAERIRKNTEQATAELDVDKLLLLETERSENEAVRKKLQSMLDRVNAIPVYPDGSIEKEWANLRERIRPEWDIAVAALRVHASAYMAAAESLLQMRDTIKSVKTELERINGNSMMTRFLTPQDTPDGMTIPKTYAAQIYSIFDNIIGSEKI